MEKNAELKQSLKPYGIRRIQYTLTLLLLDYLRAFQKEGLPLNMDTMVDDLEALFDLLMKLEDLAEPVAHE